MTAAGSATDGPLLLVVGHGTRDASGVAQFGQLIGRVRDQSAGWLRGVDGGFIELAAPTVGEAVTRLIGSGPAELVAVPLVLSAAGHGKGDIPAALAREQVRHPGLRYRYGRPLGPHPVLLDVLAARIDAALAGAPRTGVPMSCWPAGVPPTRTATPRWPRWPGCSGRDAATPTSG